MFYKKSALETTPSRVAEDVFLFSFIKMFRGLKNNRGQGIVAQYVLTFFLVVGIVSAMSVYVRRAIQGRIVDANRFMLVTVNEVFSDPGMNIVGNLHGHYEPYYVRSEAIQSQDNEQVRQNLPSLPLSSGIFRIDLDQTTTTRSNSEQAPPKDAAGQ